MKCPNCGNDVSDDYEFCHICGYELKEPSANAGTPPAVPDSGFIKTSGSHTEKSSSSASGGQGFGTLSEAGTVLKKMDNMGIALIALLVLSFVPYLQNLSAIGMLVILCLTKWSLAPAVADFFERAGCSPQALWARDAAKKSLLVLILSAVIFALFILAFAGMVAAVFFHVRTLWTVSVVCFAAVLASSSTVAFLEIYLLDSFIRCRGALIRLNSGSCPESPQTPWYIYALFFLCGVFSLVVLTISVFLAYKLMTNPEIINQLDSVRSTFPGHV